MEQRQVRFVDDRTAEVTIGAQVAAANGQAVMRGNKRYIVRGDGLTLELYIDKVIMSEAVQRESGGQATPL